MQLADYMKELRKVKTLDRAEERALWAAFKERGDECARQRLIESYQPLVFKQAAPFAQLDCVLDLIQEGTVGLIEAVEHYDHTRGVAFRSSMVLRTQAWPVAMVDRLPPSFWITATSTGRPDAAMAS